MADRSTLAHEANLLERSRELAALRSGFESVTSEGRGRLVFVSGEAGVGKTVLIRRFAAALPTSAEVLLGACDALATPRPLAPFLGVAEVTGGRLKTPATGGGKPYGVCGVLMCD